MSPQVTKGTAQYEMPDRAEESFASLGKTPVGLTEGLIPLSAYADIPAQGTPYGRLFKGGLFFYHVPLEKEDVPKGQGDYPSGTACHLPFQGRLNNSSALSGISSIRGDYSAKPPLQRRWQAAGLTEGVCVIKPRLQDDSPLHHASHGPPPRGAGRIWRG